jgi:hypothetical protein
MALTSQRSVGQPNQLGDDYLVETGAERARSPVSLRIIRFLEAVLIVVIALLSLAVFWTVGMLLGIL